MTNRFIDGCCGRTHSGKRYEAKDSHKDGPITSAVRLPPGALRLNGSTPHSVLHPLLSLRHLLRLRCDGPSTIRSR